MLVHGSVEPRLEQGRRPGNGRRADHRDRGNGRADPGDGVRDESVFDPPSRSVSSALWQTPVNLPRQCVFAGTINPPAEGYLKDSTGARRIWPVACRGMVDLAGLEVARDQLWAEAVHRFKAGAKWHLETPELEALATAEQEARFVVDDWEAPIVEWLKDRTDVSVGEVLVHALGIAKERHSQSAQNRVVRILTNRRLGFSKHRPRVPGAPGGRENRYWREPSPVKS